MGLGRGEEIVVDATSQMVEKVVLPSRALPGMVGGLSSIPLLDENPL
jgi:hypothetical protein